MNNFCLTAKLFVSAFAGRLPHLSPSPNIIYCMHCFTPLHWNNPQRFAAATLFWTMQKTLKHREINLYRLYLFSYFSGLINAKILLLFLIFVCIYSPFLQGAERSSIFQLCIIIVMSWTTYYTIYSIWLVFHIIPSLLVTFCLLVFRAARPRALCDVLAPSMGVHAVISRLVETAEAGKSGRL